jgi:hypothetical protein
LTLEVKKPKKFFSKSKMRSTLFTLVLIGLAALANAGSLVKRESEAQPEIDQEPSDR